MREEDINVKRFCKTELLETLERIFLGYYTSGIEEGLDTDEKNELVLNYLAIKKVIKQSEAA